MCTPCAAAICAEQRRRHERGDDEPVVARRCGARMWSANSQPISSPPRRRHEPSGCGIAAPSRSASGSLAIATVAPARAAQLDQQVHRARLLRVGERHRRERAVGLVLLGDDGRRRRARRRSNAAHQRRTADAVHRRVGDRRRRRRRAGSRTAGDRVEVAPSNSSSPTRVDQRIVRRRPARRRVGSTASIARRDLGVVRRHDLRAVAEVHLVAVVGRRVVRRRDHHAGGGVELGDDPRQHRRRHDAGRTASRRMPARRHARGPCRARTRRSCGGRRSR